MKRALVLVLLAACGTTPATSLDSGYLPIDSGVPFDAGVADAGPIDSGVADAGPPTVDGGPTIDAGPPLDAGTKYDHCASSFGNQLTNAFGRVDGTVVAVVPANYQQCPLPNSDHVVVQVLLDGAVYRMVVNVMSTSGNPNILIRSLHAALPAPAFAEGWHPGVTLDYPTDLNVHSDAGFQSLDLQQASTAVYDAITVGMPISVYATSSGGANASGAHLVHRNGANNDGALVLDPTSAEPSWLVFHFANQTF